MLKKSTGIRLLSAIVGLDNKMKAGNTAMRYRIKVKIKVGSAITNTVVDLDAANATIAKALAEQIYGSGSVLSVVRE